MSYDPKVWTKEPLSGDGPDWYWGRDDVTDAAPYPRGVLTAEAFTEEHFPEFVRSIHAIPSPAEIAALVDLERAVRREIDAGPDADSDNIDTALERLDEARKERGA